MCIVMAWMYMCVRVRKFHINWLCVSWIRPMNWRRSYQKATSPFCKLQIWVCFGITRVDTKFEQGSKTASVCMGWVWLSCQLATCIMNTTYTLATEWCVTFMSTGYMYHEYDLCTGDWMMCDFHVNWLHVSWIHWRLNDDGMSVTFMSTGYMYHEYTGDWMMMGWVWLSCQLATCIMNTLATEWWLWYQPATSPQNIRVCLCMYGVIQHEVRMHRLLRHRNILSTLGCFTCGTEVWLVMPLMSYGLYLHLSSFLAAVNQVFHFLLMYRFSCTSCYFIHSLQSSDTTV